MYDPGARPGNAFRNGGSNPQDTSFGTYDDAATFNVVHGFVLTANGRFAPLDPRFDSYVS
jgi:hypothetical protein